METSETLFSVLTAINTCGFDYELNSSDPARSQVRNYLNAELAKNPDGYCGLGGTGVTCPIGVGVSA